MSIFRKTVLVLILVFHLTDAFPQKTELTKNRVRYVFVDIPTIAYFGDKTFMETNIFQGYGLGFEYIVKDKVAVGLDIYRENINVRYIQTQLFRTCKGLNFTPSLKLYLSSDKKLYMGVGTKIRYVQESLENIDEVISQKYWQTSIRLGLGYKIYFFKNKRFGVDVFAGSNLILVGNSEPWTTALSKRGMFFDGSFFYKF